MSTSTVTKVPRLQQGDRLTRDEFERRYHAMPEGTRAELIEGEVHMPSPTRLQLHGNPHNEFSTWLGVYQAHTPGVRAAIGPSIRLNLDNEPEPDNALYVLPEYGGAVVISDDDYVEGAPELLGEVSASTVSIDRHKKFRVYQRNKVKEYILILTEDRRVEWYVLDGDRFNEQAPDAAGILHSRAFPGLWLDPAALLSGDLLRVLHVLEDGLASKEHTAFVAMLQERRGNG